MVTISNIFVILCQRIDVCCFIKKNIYVSKLAALAKYV